MSEEIQTPVDPRMQIDELWRKHLKERYKRTVYNSRQNVVVPSREEVEAERKALAEAKKKEEEEKAQAAAQAAAWPQKVQPKTSSSKRAETPAPVTRVTAAELDDIQRIGCELYGVSLEDLISAKQSRLVARLRQALVDFALHCGHHVNNVMLAFDRDRNSVAHALLVIGRIEAIGPQFDEDIKALSVLGALAKHFNAPLRKQLAQRVAEALPEARPMTQAAPELQRESAPSTA